MKKIILTCFVGLVTACTPQSSSETEKSEPNQVKLHDVIGKDVQLANALDQAAADFVKLALKMGEFDADYVDAYHGPKAWQDLTSSTDATSAELADAIQQLSERLKRIPVGEKEEIRKAQLTKLLRAMGVRLQVIQGEDVSFDREVAEIYDVKPPRYDLSKYDAVLADIDTLLPGEGSTADRVTAFKNSLAIPKEKLKPIFERAIAECRARTAEHFDLPENETFRMEFVTDKSWSGYNYYQGNYESLIQINTDFPIIIDRAVDLGCHEGYPGHHVWNVFVERELVNKRGWIEYSVNPLFGPFGPLAEGTGNFGVELAFPEDEKITFEREVLFPMAGLDPAKAEELQALNALTKQLSHATNEISRRYLDGEITREQAIPMIQKYYLASLEKSEQRLRFVEKYRGYVINYNIGQDIARSYVNSAGDTDEARWNAFRDMLTIPLTPGDIQVKSD